MFKKIGHLLKFLIIGVLWSTFWVALTQQIILRIWNFNYISLKQWQMVRAFWQQNGVIKGLSDYMLFIALSVVLLVWYFGFKKLYNTDYLKLFLRPFEYFNKKQIEKYESEGKHVVIKNLVVGEKMTIEDLINQKIKEEKSALPAQKESEILRHNISQKINKQKGK